MSASVTWSGLDELKAQLRALPGELAGEGAHLVEARANSATQTIGAGYPSRAGDLRKGLTVTHTRSAFGARSIVKNTDPAALVFDVGSQARHTSLGANRGAMPANPIFSQTCRRERRAMYQDLSDLLVRKGLRVSGAF